MMIPVWLYSKDGRALYCVYVATPMPAAVEYPPGSGSVYDWDAAARHYRHRPVYQAGSPGEAPFTATHEVRPADRPDPDEPTEFRQ